MLIFNKVNTITCQWVLRSWMCLKARHVAVPFIFTLIFLNACSLQEYQPKPLSPEQSQAAFHKRSLKAPDLKAFLALQNVAVPQQDAAWSLNSLVNTALFFHPDLALARAQYQTSQLAIKQGKLKKLPTVNTQIARSNRENGDIDPFAFSLSIDLPVQTNNKQAIRVAGLTHISDRAKLDIAQTAWQIRHRVIKATLALHHQAQSIELAKTAVKLNQAMSQILQKRFDYGEASKLQLHQAMLALHTQQNKLTTLEQNNPPLKAILAKQLGVPFAEVASLSLDYNAFTDEHSATLTTQQNRTEALINRIDIRQAILSYAIAENQLRLAVAKQIPDLSLSPGYAFEFGDNVWSLGFNSLLAILQKNKVGIEKAMQLREVEVAKFAVIQTQVISDAQIASATLKAARHRKLIQAQALKAANIQLKRTQKQFDAGQINRLDLTIAKVGLLNAEQNLLNSTQAADRAALALENQMQLPIFTQHKPASDISNP